MKAVIQRVARASVIVVDGDQQVESGRIGPGLVVLIGVAVGDGEAEARRLAAKIVALRLFPDESGKMNRDLREGGGAILVISQFTLFADTHKGRRPSFIGAARPEEGEPLYEAVIAALRATGVVVETGRFGAHMLVEIVNDGPVTIILDTAEWATGG